MLYSCQRCGRNDKVVEWIVGARFAVFLGPKGPEHSRAMNTRIRMHWRAWQLSRCSLCTKRGDSLFVKLDSWLQTLSSNMQQTLFLYFSSGGKNFKTAITESYNSGKPICFIVVISHVVLFGPLVT